MEESPTPLVSESIETPHQPHHQPHLHHHLSASWSHSHVHDPSSHPGWPNWLPEQVERDHESSLRTEILRELRSERLIGESKPLFDWCLRYMTPRELSDVESKRVVRFYKRQNCMIENLEEIDELLDTGISHSLLEEYGDDIGVEEPRQRQQIPQTLNIRHAHEELRRPSSRTVRLWINVNLAANILLLAGKVAVALLTDSLSVVASMIDSLLDLLSTVIIWISTHIADQRDWKTKHLYPVGRTRLEPIGVLVFSIIMVVSFLKVANESIQRLLAADSLPVIVGPFALTIMFTTVVVKVALYFCCRNIHSSAVQALAQDALTDIVFNLASIFFPVLGHYFYIWWFDPLGALVLSAYVVCSWGSVAFGHIDNLTGSAASPEERHQILYLCMRFSSRVRYVTALNVYHAGDRLMCEVDLLLDQSLSLRDSHDLAECLQYAIETLPTVERAFVHLDYRRENFTGHVSR